MALDKEALKNTLRSIDPSDPDVDIIDVMVDAIDTYVRGMVVTVPSGIKVGSLANPPTQTGRTMESVNATIS